MGKEAEERERARRPEDLGRLFVERANAGDIDGLVARCEPDAVLALPGGDVASGAEAIPSLHQGVLARRRTFVAVSQRPPLFARTRSGLRIPVRGYDPDHVTSPHVQVRAERSKTQGAPGS